MLSFSAGLTVQKAPFSGILSRRFLRPAPLHFFDASLFGRVSPSTRIRRHVAPFLGEPSSSSFRTSARAKRRDEARQSWPQSISPTAYRVREGHASHYCDQARCSSSISALATRRRAAPHLPDCLGARPLDDVADVLSCFRIGVSAL